MTTKDKTWLISRPTYNRQGETSKPPVIVQVVDFLNSKFEIRKNEVKMRVEMRVKNPSSKWQEVGEQEIATLIVQMKAAGLQVTRVTIDTLFDSLYLSSFDPIRSYFDDLPAWDGEDYICQLANTIQTDDNEVWKIYLQKWLVSMVRSAINKRGTNQQMLVFYGRQGVGKTRWILKLLPNRLQDYLYTGYTNFEDQMFKLRLARYLLIFLDELDSYKGSGQAIIKATITQEIVRLRPLYSSFDIEVKRRASFIAAINNETFLHDFSGSRRFLVVECLSVNTDHTIDMDKVFSQVLSLAQDESYRHYFDPSETEKIELHNERYKSKSELELVVDQFLEPASEADVWARKMNATEIISLLREELDYPLYASPVKLGEAMHRLGFNRVSVGVGKEKRMKYLVKVKS